VKELYPIVYIESIPLNIPHLKSFNLSLTIPYYNLTMDKLKTLIEILKKYDKKTGKKYVVFLMF